MKAVGHSIQADAYSLQAATRICVEKIRRCCTPQRPERNESLCLGLGKELEKLAARIAPRDGVQCRVGRELVKFPNKNRVHHRLGWKGTVSNPLAA